MNPIINALNVEKLSKSKTSEITKDPLLNKDHIDFITDIIQREVPVLVVCDRDLDGTTGLSGGLHASNTGVLPKSWKHSYSWGKTVFDAKHPESSGTFGVSLEQIEHFYDKNNFDSIDEVVIVTVDNGSTSEHLQALAREKYPNIKFLITDHHLSSDNTRDVSDIYINPSDDYNKDVSTWVEFVSKDSDNVFESHVSGGMLWNLILKEIKFHQNNKNQELSPKHQIIGDNPDDFHMRTGLLSQWCDLITFGPDFEEAFRVNLKNKNLQQLPIFNYVKSLEWSGMTDDNWVPSFRDKIRKVSSIVNTTKRLDFLLSSNDFQKTLDDTGVDFAAMDKKYNGNIAETLKLWNTKVSDKLNKDFPSLETGNIPALKYVYIFNIFEDNEMMDIIEGLAEIKNYLLKSAEYSIDQLNNTQIFFTENPLMRGITSIKCFIEKSSPVLFNISPDDYTDGTITLKGSYRSDISETFDDINTHDFQHGKIKLAGHSKAAGVTMSFKEEDRDLFLNEVDDHIANTIRRTNYTPPQPKSISYKNIIDASKSLIEDQNYYVFSEPLIFTIDTKDLISQNNIESKVSKKSGMHYINHKDYKNNIATLGFNVEYIPDTPNLLVELSVVPNRNIPMVQVSISDKSKDLIVDNKITTKPNISPTK